MHCRFCFDATESLFKSWTLIHDCSSSSLNVYMFWTHVSPVKEHLSHCLEGHAMCAWTKMGGRHDPLALQHSSNSVLPRTSISSLSHFRNSRHVNRHKFCRFLFLSIRLRHPTLSALWAALESFHSLPCIKMDESGIAIADSVHSGA